MVRATTVVAVQSTLDGKGLVLVDKAFFVTGSLNARCVLSSRKGLLRERRWRPNRYVGIGLYVPVDGQAGQAGQLVSTMWMNKYAYK